MKKLFSIIALAVALSVTSFAQNFHSINFLAPISNIQVTNGLGWTNLQSITVLPTTGASTNIVGLQWTNILGNRVIAAAGDYTQLAVDVPLWVDAVGRPIVYNVAANSSTNTAILSLQSGYTLNIHILSGGSGANAAVNFTISPVFDGTHEATSTADNWIVGVTANTTSAVNVSTNVPIWRWPGCKQLRLQSITDTDTDATSQVVIDSVTLNGFVP